MNVEIQLQLDEKLLLKKNFNPFVSEASPVILHIVFYSKENFIF